MPPDAEFDPDATGIYSFELLVGQQESVAIDVVIGEAPEPAALGLPGFGLVGLAAARRA